MSERIVGIDLGTSNTVVAVVDELDRIKILPDAEGHTVHPSVVSFHPNGGVVVGVHGKERKVRDPKNTIYSAKRMIGQPFKSFAVTETARRVPFEIKEGPNEQAMVVTRTGEFAIPEISAIVLDHARKVAVHATQEDVSRAVVTVPASFTDVQRASTATAGALAGLTVVRVLNEPTAAALAYGSTKRLNEIIAVYDFGGGTFDITILQLDDQVYTVLGTSGDAFLGGEDIDERIVERMVDSFLRQHRIDLRTDDVSMMRLRAVAEHTKIELSRRSRAVLKIEEIAYAPNGSPLDLEMQVTRDELVSSIGDLVDRTFVSCKEAMALAGVAPERIADVILVGGTTRIPFVREQVSRFFGMSPRSDMNPDDAVAHGAALQASSIEQMLSRAPQRPPASIPIPVDDLIGEVLAEKPTRIDPEPARSRIAEVKRPERGSDMFSGKPREGEPAPKRRKEEPAKTAARAEAFFGDLFGDTPAKPDEGQPATAKPGDAPVTQPATAKAIASPASEAAKPSVRIPAPAPSGLAPAAAKGPAPAAKGPAPASAPGAKAPAVTKVPGAKVPMTVPAIIPAKVPSPAGPAAAQKPASTSTDDARPARSRPARESLDWAPPSGTAFSDDEDAVDVFAPEPVKAEARLADLSDDVEPEGADEATDLSDEIDDFAADAPRKAPARPPKLANVDDIAIEVVEPSMPAIRLDEVGGVRRAPRRRDPNEIEVSMPAIELDELDDMVEVVPAGHVLDDDDLAIEVEPSVAKVLPAPAKRDAPPARASAPSARAPARAQDEISMPSILLDEIDEVEVVPTRRDATPAAPARPAPVAPTTRLDAPARPAPAVDDDDEMEIEVSVPAISLDEIDDVPSAPTRLEPAKRPEPGRRSPQDLDSVLSGEDVELAREIVVPARGPARGRDASADDLELAAPSTPRSRVALELDDVPPMRPDDFSDDADMPLAPPGARRAHEFFADDSDVPLAPRRPAPVEFFDDEGMPLASGAAAPADALVRRAPPELDWDPTPHAHAPIRAEPVPMRPAPEAPQPSYTRALASVIDVTPRSLGIGTVAGFCEELIRRNSQLPAAIRKSFVTSRDAQDTVRIVICQGESRRLDRNLVIGDLVLPNLPRRARGETRIDVEFALDASGILHVSARDSATGAEQRAKLDLKGGMAPEDMTVASKRIQELSRTPLD